MFFKLFFENKIKDLKIQFFENERSFGPINFEDRSIKIAGPLLLLQKISSRVIMDKNKK